MSEWISVETAMPEESKDVLIYGPSPKLCNANTIGRIYGKRWETDLSDSFGDQILYEREEVTHWHELPPAPVKGEQG